MNIKLQVFVLIGLFLISCQNKTPDNRKEWIINIDKVIEAYDIIAVIDTTKTLVEDNGYGTFTSYKKSVNEIYKIKGVIVDSKNFLDFTQEFYIQNDKILLSKMYGTFPLLYKHRKEKKDPCCQVFERVSYFKNDSEQKQYLKEINIMNEDEKALKLNDLDNLEFKEVDKEYISYDYFDAEKSLEEIKYQLFN
ncbi:MAG: hypothetical protein ABJK28_07035 [Algibacter sp.]